MVEEEEVEEVEEEEELVTARPTTDGQEKSGIGVPAVPKRNAEEPMSPTTAPVSSPAYDIPA